MRAIMMNLFDYRPAMMTRLLRPNNDGHRQHFLDLANIHQ
jgi:hypothetical protein